MMAAVTMMGCMQVGMGQADAQSAADTAHKATLLAQKMSMQGVVTTPLGGTHCLTGNSTEIHDLGLIPMGTTVRVRFQSNFDPVAAAMLFRMGADSVNTDVTRESDAAWADDDDSGILLDPLLNFVTPHTGSLFVFVSQFSTTAHGIVAKCYDFEATFTPPPTTTPPTTP